MSIWDEFSGLVDELFDEFELPPVKIERTTTVQTKADKAAGRKGTPNTVTTFGKGTQKKRRVTLASGAIVHESVVLIDKLVLIGDKLTLGNLSFTVKSVETNDPIGMGAYTYLAVVA